MFNRSWQIYLTNVIVWKRKNFYVNYDQILSQPYKNNRNYSQFRS